MARADISRVLVDWGTTSMRLWCVDPHQTVMAQHHAALGMTKMAPADYPTVLDKILTELQVPQQVPVLICGMAGAAQGWVDAGYADVPVDLAKLGEFSTKVTTGNQREVCILPGLAQREENRPDVMRGEETALLGALLSGAGNGIYCLPGTHSKWVFASAGRIDGFTTFMTGELFALIGQHSTLSAYVHAGSDGRIDEAAFVSGLDVALASSDAFIGALFAFRAEPLLTKITDPEHAASRLSGMLVGAELAAMRNRVDDRVGLIAAEKHAQIYRLAFDHIGMDCDLLDGHAMTMAGLFHAAETIWG